MPRYKNSGLKGTQKCMPTTYVNKIYGFIVTGSPISFVDITRERKIEYEAGDLGTGVI